MKKTSRRRFGKQLAGAIAAIPIVSSVVEAQQPQTIKADSQKTQAKMFREHDTPPPLVLMSGSMIIEARTDKNDWGVGSQSGNDRKHLILPKDNNDNPPPNGSNIFIAHVKIIDGSGDLLFKFDNDQSATKNVPIVVTAVMDGNANEKIRVSHEGRNFALLFPKDHRKIDKKANDLPMGKHRQRARYLDDNGSDSHELSSVAVMKGAQQLFFIETAELPSKGEELRILLWWELLP
jgi:hypothetical protein